MNYLVTGGAGFIGSHLVDRLLKDGNYVTVLDNFSTGRLENLKNKGVKLFKKDICENLGAVFKKRKFDKVFHLAGLPLIQLSIKNPEETAKSAVNGTLNLLEHCLKFSVKKFVYVSSSAVYGNPPMNEEATPNPLSPYGIQKLMGEQYCQFFTNIHGLETVIFRAFSVYGPRQIPNNSYGVVPRFIQAVENKKEIVINGDGTQTRDFIFVSDVVEALVTTPSKGIFNLGSGQNISINGLAKKIIGKKEIKIIHNPALVEQKDTLADISKSKKILGWEPEVTLEEGLRITAQSFARNIFGLGEK
ncbi:NAD-dependent epimerase/dehydratase family protein [Candidatus Gottesmanbacteria bacterium]|nr:NAD-dependent epimerase/dehydratase family protein [Candidatus Gottesmanbacteria bacterium]